MPAVKKIRVESYDPLTNTSTVNGVVAVTQGGTGATTATNALTNLLPNQAGYSGYFLGSNGINAAWAVPSGGGGGGGSVPKITNIQITDASYNVIDDTAVNTGGGYIKITGTDFVSGCSVVIGSTSATSVTFASSTTLNCQVPAQTAGTYIVYVVNPDGGVGVRVNGLTYSDLPNWQTASALGEYSVDAPISIQFLATDATSYVLQAGSSLPPGLSLSSGGLLSGTVTGVPDNTVYTFTVVAIDAQSQDSPRTFTVTISVTDPYFIYNSLLLRSDTAAQSFSTDASTNNFYATINGDVKGSEFTPFLTGWSNYFDGGGDYLSIASNTAFDLGSSNFTMEAWVYSTAAASAGAYIANRRPAGSPTGWLFSGNEFSAYINGAWRQSAITVTVPTNQWFHVALVRNGNIFTLYHNGVSVGTYTQSGAIQDLARSLIIGVGGDTTEGPLTGYLSNFRMIVGTALYTSNFTPPTSALTAVTGTQLLTCQNNSFIDNSTNNFSITRGGDAAVSSNNPFNLYNTGTGGSAYFDGTGDYLVLPSNAAFTVGTGNLTIEAWIYCTSLSQPYQGIVSGRADIASNYPGLGLVIDNSKLSFTILNSGSALTDSVNVTLNQWVHVVGVRSGTNAALFVNGSRKASSTNSENSTSSDIVIGRFYVGTNNYYFNGYISNVRIVKGTAVYDPTLTTLTVPTAPLTAIANTSLLTCQYSQSSNNNTFLDTSYYNNVLTRSGNTTTSTFTPFYNNYSVYFDGTGDYLTIPRNTALLPEASQDFTFEAWFYATAMPNAQGAQIMGFNSYGATSDWTIGANSSGQVALYFNNNSTTYTNTTVTFSLNTWNHVAASRSGTGSNNLKVFLNGVGQSFTTNVAPNNGTSLIFSIGADQEGDGNLFTGYISNVRIIKGTGIYTSNFTPPTSPLTVITNTSLLTCQSNRFIDNSTNNFSITSYGNTAISKFSCFTLNQFYSVAQYGGSMYFDGTGDWLTTSNTGIFNFSSASVDFTIEAWIYNTGPGQYRGITGARTNGTAHGWCLYIHQNNTFYMGSIIVGQSYSERQLNTTVIPGNSWTHIALVKDATGYTGYVNGVGGTKIALANGLDYQSGSALIVGALGSGGEYPFTGYISNFRIIKGTAVYTANFTPPTAPVITPNAQTNLLLTGSAAGVYDVTGINAVETLANASASTAQTKFLTASMYFDGTGDYLGLVGNPELQIGNKNFTIECWVYPTASVTSTILTLANVISTGYSAIRARMNTSRQIELYISSDGGTWAASGTTPTALTLNVWSYVTIVRNGSGTGNIQVYINGTSALTLTFAGTAYTAASLKYSIGAVWTASSPAEFWTGWMSDLRITMGIARYTGNFTPPTQPNRLR